MHLCGSLDVLDWRTEAGKILFCRVYVLDTSIVLVAQRGSARTCLTDDASRSGGDPPA
jgi:hypothetical protein